MDTNIYIYIGFTFNPSVSGSSHDICASPVLCLLVGVHPWDGAHGHIVYSFTVYLYIHSCIHRGETVRDCDLCVALLAPTQPYASISAYIIGERTAAVGVNKCMYNVYIYNIYMHKLTSRKYRTTMATQTMTTVRRQLLYEQRSLSVTNVPVCRRTPLRRGAWTYFIFIYSLSIHTLLRTSGWNRTWLSSMYDSDCTYALCMYMYIYVYVCIHIYIH